MRRKRTIDDLLGRDDASKLLNQSSSLIGKGRYVLKTTKQYYDIENKLRQKIYSLIKKTNKKPRTKQQLEKIGCEFYQYRCKKYARFSHQLITKNYYWVLEKDNLYHPRD